MVAVAVGALLGLAGALQARADADGGEQSDAGSASGTEGPIASSFDGGVLEPPELLEDSPAPYPSGLADAGVSGDVKLSITIDATGSVTDVALAVGVGPELDAAALEAARKLKFKPALLDGLPTAVVISFVYHFAAPQQRPEVAPVGFIQGLVRTRGTRRPIAGATVFEPASGTTVETDAAGRFALPLPPGDHLLQIYASGHATGNFVESLEAGQVLEVVYGLTPDQVHPYETIVRTDRERAELSRVTLRDQELQEVAGTMGDPLRVIMLLPGVGTVMSGIAYPVVRGAPPADTGYFIDGVRVPLLFHLLLGPEVIAPEFIDRIDFYAGAPPVQYGRLLQGVVDARITVPRDDGFHATVFADLINAGAYVEVPILRTGTSITAAARISYTPLLISALSNAAEPPGSPTLVLNFSDYQLRVDQKLGTGALRLFIFGSNDRVGTTGGGMPGQSETIGFNRFDLRYQHPLGVGLGEIALTYGVDYIGASGLLLNETGYGGRARWTGPLGSRLSLEVGGDFQNRSVDISDSGQSTDVTINTLAPQVVGTFEALYTQLTWQPGGGLTIVPGLRLDNYHIVPVTNFLALEPRLIVRKILSDAVTLRFAAGLYNQPPEFLVPLPAADLALLGQGAGLQRAAQFDIGADWQVRPGIDVQADVYYDPLFKTIEQDLTPGLETNKTSNVGSSSVPAIVSHGRAYGFDLLVRHPLGGNWFGWLAYSLQRSERFRTYDLYDPSGNVIGTASGTLPSPLDETHNLNAVASYQLPRGWIVGLVFHVNSGRPEAGFPTGDTTHQLTPDGWVRVSANQFDRLPAFFRIDFRVSKTWIYETHTIEVYLDVLNATVSQEVLGYSYRSFPTAKVPLSIPLFLPIVGIKATY